MGIVKKEKLEEWSNRPYNETHKFFSKHFKKVLNGGYSFCHYKTVEQKLQFFKQWYL